MAGTSASANAKWVTILTLRISFKNNTFKESMRRELFSSQRPMPQCTCSNIRNLHPYSSAKHQAQGLLPADTFTARFVMTDASKIDQASKLCAKEVIPDFEHDREFRYWILSLAILLSHICEADHSTQPRQRPQRFGTRPFNIGLVTKRNVCGDLIRLLGTPLNPSEKERHGLGYVYIIRSQLGASTASELKIGFTKYHPEHRAHELASCYAMPEVVGHTPLLPHAKRLESIIHAELRAVRKVHSCMRCESDHQEWFTITHGEAREVVTRWSRWLLQRPYRDGQLTDKWKDHLSRTDLESVDDDTTISDFWQATVDAFPADGVPGAKSCAAGEYLNECHWEILSERMGLDIHGKVIRDTLRAIYEDSRTRSPYSDAEVNVMTDYLDELDLLEENEKDSHSDFGDLHLPKHARKRKVYTDEPFGNWTNKNTRMGRMFHPAMPSGFIMRPDFSEGPVLAMIKR